MNKEINAAADLLARHQPVLALTGAGISTDSGIPAYRNRSGQWSHPRPVQHKDFLDNELVRKRYWLRSMYGWPRFAGAKPNGSHHALTRLQHQSIIETIITQNVDGLHTRAGASNVIDLHGELAKIRCLQCDSVSDRAAMQKRLEDKNPDFLQLDSTPGPDGDASTTDVALSWFSVPACTLCSGTLKPDVVFFGANVPKNRVDQCQKALANARSLLVCGSSLMVFSGFRYCRTASSENKPLIIINQGVTRADGLATCKLDMNCHSALQHLETELCQRCIP